MDDKVTIADLECVINWLEHGCDVSKAVDELRLFRDKIISQAQEAPKIREGKRVRCNHCMSEFDEENIDVDAQGPDTGESCPVCSKSDALMDIDAAPKAESGQSAEELVSKIREAIHMHDADGNVCGVYDYRLTDAEAAAIIEADRAAQRSLGAEDIASVYGGNLDMLEDYYSELVEAARGISKEWAILPSEMKYDLPSVKTWLIRYMGVQIKALNKALADLAEGRRR